MKHGSGESEIKTISGQRISSSLLVSLSSFPIIKELYNLKSGKEYNIHKPFLEHVIAIFKFSCIPIDEIGEL